MVYWAREGKWVNGPERVNDSGREGDDTRTDRLQTDLWYKERGLRQRHSESDGDGDRDVNEGRDRRRDSKCTTECWEWYLGFAMAFDGRDDSGVCSVQRAAYGMRFTGSSASGAWVVGAPAQATAEVGPRPHTRRAAYDGARPGETPALQGGRELRVSTHARCRARS